MLIWDTQEYVLFPTSLPYLGTSESGDDNQIFMSTNGSVGYKKIGKQCLGCQEFHLTNDPLLLGFILKR